MNSSKAADDGGNGMLQCMSPLILRHVNKLFDMPLDPARMMYLPMQCGVIFPAEFLYVCMSESLISAPLFDCNSCFVHAPMACRLTV